MRVIAVVFGGYVAALHALAWFGGWPHVAVGALTLTSVAFAVWVWPRFKVALAPSMAEREARGDSPWRTR